ncbi:MAG: hypothetical protein KKB90_00055 [Actinobacteria bacterium]|nr:hypothetical protein [Actinomycetota bacterium]MBU4217341.1 hypothetical protein [Actinomycetota bacterium]MBU4359506.1 hypothetical protein [Actinomycetota bacterium]MBU4392896.1 hypothetical protein [Actinomycetota bacterium]MBU4403527.1 hypothetical protein [Actinomycetota bacterium]
MRGYDYKMSSRKKRAIERDHGLAFDEAKRAYYERYSHVINMGKGKKKVLGQDTDSDKYITSIGKVERKVFWAFTARPMDNSEHRRYRKARKQRGGP